MDANRVYNFNPGPAILPYEALMQIKNELMEFGGMSILEISHRGADFLNILKETKSLLSELMSIPDTYEILFLQGGASIHFAMIPMNFLETSADYVITGHWSKKAKSAATELGKKANVVFSSEEGGFKRVPRQDELKFNSDANYVHITTNNTIFGTEYQYTPDTGNVPLFADMSSDIFSQRIDVSRFGMIYAGAQKNLGPSGVSVVIIRKDLLAKKLPGVPAILSYATHAENDSLYNTPPVFAIFTLNRVLKYCKSIGGIETIERTNRQKAAMLYETLDTSGFYKSHAEKDSRSIMNITFTLPSQELTDKFIGEAKKLKLMGLKGHRSVGGIRASIYNAFPLEGVKVLCDFMKEFEKTA